MPFMTACFTLLLGTVGAALLGWLAHFASPLAGWVVFGLAEAGWALTAWRIVFPPEPSAAR